MSSKVAKDDDPIHDQPQSNARIVYQRGQPDAGQMELRTHVNHRTKAETKLLSPRVTVTAVLSPFFMAAAQ